MNTTRECTSYRVRCSPTATLSPSGYDKYNERWRMAQKGEITDEEVYGLEQCREHIQQLLNTTGRWADDYQRIPYTIEKVTQVIEVVELVASTHPQAAEYDWYTEYFAEKSPENAENEKQAGSAGA